MDNDNQRSYDEVKKLAVQQQRTIIKNTICKNRELASGTFASNLESLTRVSEMEEENEIEESLNQYLKPEVDHRYQSTIQSHVNSEKINNGVINSLIESKKRDITKTYEKKIFETHLEKVKKLKYAAEVVGMNPDDIQQLLELPAEEFETDIGVADAEMDSIRVEIFNLENKRRQNQANHVQSKVELKDVIETMEQKKKQTKILIPELRQELQERKEEASKYEEEYGGISLTTMDRITTENLNEIQRIKSNHQELQKAIQTMVKSKKDGLESEKKDLENEAKEIDRKCNEWVQRVKDLMEKDKQRGIFLKNLEKSIETLKHECENFVSNFEIRKKETHLKCNEKFSEMLLYEQLQPILEKAKKFYSLEVSQRSNENSSLIESLQKRKKDLEDQVLETEKSIKKCIDDATFMKSIAFDSIHLPHSILSRFLEEKKNLLPEWMKLIETKTKILAQQASKPFIENQKTLCVLDKFADSILIKDIFSSTIGVVSSPDDIFERESDLERIKKEVVKQTFQQQRLAKFLQELVNSYEKKRYTKEPRKVKLEEQNLIKDIAKKVEELKKKLEEKKEIESDSEEESDLEHDSDLESSSESEYFSDEENEEQDLTIPTSVNVVQYEVSKIVESIKMSIHSKINPELEFEHPTPEANFLSKTFFKRKSLLQVFSSRRKEVQVREKSKILNYSFLKCENVKGKSQAKERVFSRIQNIRSMLSEYVDLKRVDGKLEREVLPNINAQKRYLEVIKENITRNETLNKETATPQKVKQGINQLSETNIDPAHIESLKSKSYSSLPVIRPSSFGL